jgi:hypothetical protein
MRAFARKLRVNYGASCTHEGLSSLIICRWPSNEFQLMTMNRRAIVNRILAGARIDVQRVFDIPRVLPAREN